MRRGRLIHANDYRPNLAFAPEPYQLGGLVRKDKLYAFVLSERDGKWRFVEEDWFAEGK